MKLEISIISIAEKLPHDAGEPRLDTACHGECAEDPWKEPSENEGDVYVDIGDPLL